MPWMFLEGARHPWELRVKRKERVMRPRGPKISIYLFRLSFSYFYLDSASPQILAYIIPSFEASIIISNMSGFISFEPYSTPLTVAVASFANIFCIGSVYTLSTIQAQLPYLFAISDAYSLVLFGVACLGLLIGVTLSASMIF